MKLLDTDKIIFENRQEIADIQDVCETFISISKSSGEKNMREAAEKLSGLLEKMYANWQGH